MESAVLISDRPEIREALRRALRPGPSLHVIPSSEWRRGAIGATRDRLFILDLPTVASMRPLLSVAESWPHGFGGCLLVILPAEGAAAYQPNQIVDDLLVQPFTDAEAGLRVRNLLWRNRMAATPEVMQIGDLSIDNSRYEVSVAGRPLDLTYKEYELLRFLASNPGRVYTRDLLLSRVWGEDYFGGTRTVDVHVRRLRVKLGTDHEACIGTVRNVGYRFQSIEAAGKSSGHAESGGPDGADDGNSEDGASG